MTVTRSLTQRSSEYFKNNGLIKTARRGGYELATFFDVPWMLLSWGLPGPTNRREFRIVAQRRSGQHAIVNWVTKQLSGRYCFLNNCRPGRNPFESCQKETSEIVGLMGVKHSWAFWRQETSGRLSKKGTLLYNFEDVPVEAITSDSFESCREKWVGKSERRSDILILRDPFNLFASRLQWFDRLDISPTLSELSELRELWKNHAREFIGITNRLEEPIKISYHKWFASEQYRQEIAKALSLTWDDCGVQEVAKWGPTVNGASFDGLAFDGRASQMKVLERWKAFSKDRRYLYLIDDDELRDLAGKAFEPIRGTESLVS